MTYRDALALARAVVGDPCAQLRPKDPPPGTDAAARLAFADKVVTELEHRKRRMGVLGYDDLLGRLAKALESEQSPARDRMRQRWPIVMVDEFQDTDPVQWQVIDRAFSGHSTVILIGDPKQAIYAFRGGDIVTYLEAADTARDRRLTLGVNWRSDKVLVDSLHAVWGGAELGHPDIVVRDIDAQHSGHRLSGAPHNDPFRLRVVGRDRFGVDQDRTIAIKQLRPYIAEDLATDISALLASGAMFDGKPVTAGDIAVIVEKGDDARPCRDALATIGIPVIYTGDTDVFDSDAAADWLALLEAFDQPHRSGIVRAAAATMFFGKTADDLAAGGDALTEQVTATIREWAGQARERGVAAVYEAAQLAGMDERVLRRRGGERDMTDLAHVGQLLHEVAHRERFNLPALRDWLRRQREERSGPDERNRRLDSDAAAVQIMTVWGSKGLQFPIVYLPFAFNRHVRVDDVALFHDDSADGASTRCLHIGGKHSPDRGEVEELSKAEEARNDIRLTYVALTRAKSQVVAWWAPSWDEPTGGLSRLLRGRRVGDKKVPDRCSPTTVPDEVALERFREWQDAGGPVVELAAVGPAFASERPELPFDLDVRHFHRTIDTQWRRTSYSALIKAAEPAGVASEPEVTARDDEADTVPVAPPAPVHADLVSPMAELPAGATFGSLVHAVLESADPLAPDLAIELETHIREQLVWWAVDVEPPVLAEALLPMHDTPLGPLADDLTLRQIGLSGPVAGVGLRDPAGRWGSAGARAGGAIGRCRQAAGQAIEGGRPVGAVRGPAEVGCARRAVAAGLSVGVDRRGAAVAVGPVRRCRLQDEQVGRFRGGLRAVTTGRGDAAFGLPAAGAALFGCAAPISAVAAAGLRPPQASWRRDVPVRSRDVRAADTGDRRSPLRGVQLDAAGEAGDRAVRHAGQRAVGGMTGPARGVQCGRGAGRSRSSCRATDHHPWR